MTWYKLARPDGWDFFSGKIINYREAIGSTVKAPTFRRTGDCGHGLHISQNPNDCFIGARIPCSAYEVEPGRAIDRIDATKSKARSLRVVREIPDLDALFGWRYSDAVAPINPFALPVPPITGEVWNLVDRWASVRDSVGDSVGDSVRDSVWDSVRDSVGASVWASVWDSVWDSVGASVGASVWASVGDSVGASVGASVGDSVWASVRAYIGSLLPNIATWQYVKHEPGLYPFQPAVNLWHIGLVPSFDGKTWRLHGGSEGKVLGKREAKALVREAIG